MISTASHTSWCNDNGHCISAHNKNCTQNTTARP